MAPQITDPGLISELNAGPAAAPAADQRGAGGQVTDPDLIKELDTAAQAQAAEAPSPSWGETAGDIGKSAATGALIDFPIGMAGLPGDVGSLINRGVDYALGKAADVTGYEALRGDEQPAREGGPMFGSQQIRRGVESMTGALYEPQTTAGKYARSVGEFAPLALTGPGALVPRIARQAALPGLLSEGAGQLTAGTAAEPYARAAGALVGGVGGVARGERAVAEAAQRQFLDELPGATKDLYKAVDRATTGVPFDWKMQFQLKNQLLGDLQANRIFPFNSKAAYDAINDLGQVKDVAGLVAWRQATRAELYKKGLSDSAKIMTEGADNAIDAAMPAGRPGADLLRTADKEYSIRKMLESLDKRFEKAEAQTAAANSAANLDNKIRQSLVQFKQNRRAWDSLTPTQQFNVDRIIDGKWDVNVLRRISNVLGGGGGLGHMVSSGLISMIFGLKTGGAAYLVGPALKRLENRLTQGRAHDLLGELAERSLFAQGQPLRAPSLAQQLPRTGFYGALAPQLTPEGYPYYQAAP